MDNVLAQRLIAALENLANLQRPNRAETIIKQIAYIKEFSGDRKQLTQFLTTVGGHLSAIDEESREEAWQVIYNIKITGAAKELLLNNRPENWESARNLLKQHFRPSTNYKDLSRRITQLKVCSISDLNSKIEYIIEEINTFATYESNTAETRQTFYALLVNRIKQIVSGNLSRDIRNLFDLHEVKEILYSYVGYDQDNLDRETLYQERKNYNSQDYRKHHNKQDNRQKQSGNHGQYNSNFGRPNRVESNQYRSSSGHFWQDRQNSRLNNFRDSGFRSNNNPTQHRQHSWNRSDQVRRSPPKPMEIGTVTHRRSNQNRNDPSPGSNSVNEEVHNIEPEFFMN